MNAADDDVAGGLTGGGHELELGQVGTVVLAGAERHQAIFADLVVAADGGAVQAVGSLGQLVDVAGAGVEVGLEGVPVGFGQAAQDDAEAVVAEVGCRAGVGRRSDQGCGRGNWPSRGRGAWCGRTGTGRGRSSQWPTVRGTDPGAGSGAPGVGRGSRAGAVARPGRATTGRHRRARGRVQCPCSRGNEPRWQTSTRCRVSRRPARFSLILYTSLTKREFRG